MRVLVTHDPVNAYALADRGAILDSGRVVQIGTLSQVTAHPRSRYVADLVGTNLVAGNVVDGVLTTESGAQVVIADAAAVPPSAFIRPQAYTLTLVIPADPSSRILLSRRVGDIDRLADRV